MPLVRTEDEERSSQPGGDQELAVIVAARRAWPLYRSLSLYVCQPERSFQPVDYMGFYSDRTIYPRIAKVLLRRTGVSLEDPDVVRLLLSVDPDDQMLGAAVEAVRPEVSHQPHQVFLLTSFDDPRTVRIPEIHHAGASAWTMNQRYQTLGALRVATTTADLP